MANINDALTDIEREALELEEAALQADPGDETPEAKKDDTPWLADARADLKGLLTDEELAALALDEDEGGEDEVTPPADPEPAPAAQPEPEKVEPEPVIDLTAEDMAKIKADTAKKMDELDDKYDLGDLTREELRAERARILAAEVEAAEALRQERAADAEEKSYAARVETYKAEAKAFFAANPGIAKAEVLPRFDTIQKQVQQDPDFAGKKPADIFTEAKARLADEARRQGKVIPGLTDPPPRKTHVTREIPPSLGAVPVAAVNTPEGSELSKIINDIMNEADPEVYEAKFNRLTPEQQDRALRGDY